MNHLVHDSGPDAGRSPPFTFLSEYSYNVTLVSHQQLSRTVDCQYT